MKDNGIQYFNRYTGKVETEVVYGERWLRFILFNPFGKIALHTVAKRAWFSRWYGWRMSGAVTAYAGWAWLTGRSSSLRGMAAAVHRAVPSARQADGRRAGLRPGAELHGTEIR